MKISLISLPPLDLVHAKKTLDMGYDVLAQTASAALARLGQGDLAITTSEGIAQEEDSFTQLWGKGVRIVPVDGFSQWDDPEIVSLYLDIPLEAPQEPATVEPAPQVEEHAEEGLWSFGGAKAQTPTPKDEGATSHVSVLPPEAQPLETATPESEDVKTPPLVNVEPSDVPVFEDGAAVEVADGAEEEDVAVEGVAGGVGGEAVEGEEKEDRAEQVIAALSTPFDNDQPTTESVDHLREEALATLNSAESFEREDISAPQVKRRGPSLQEQARDLLAKQEKETKRSKDLYQPMTPSNHGYCLMVTSGFGGSGKTTLSYYSAHTTAMALRRAHSDMGVILIEADYMNPKLQNRLDIPAGRDLSGLVQLLEKIRSGEITSQEREEAFYATMDNIVVPTDHGFSVLASPYDTTSTASPEMLEDALVKAVMWAQRREGMFVIVDAHILGFAQGAYLNLVEMANSIVIVTDAMGLEPQGKKRRRRAEVGIGDVDDVSHLDDTVSRLTALVTPYEQNGFGQPTDKLSVFFNRTSEKEIMERVVEPRRLSSSFISGNYNYLPQIERGWAGNLFDNSDKTLEVARHTSEFLHRVTGLTEFRSLLEALPR